MTTTVLISKISTLPNSLKSDLLNYLELLIKKNKSATTLKHPKAGCMKGTFKMSSDFNTPLDDFNEYMK